MSTIGSGERTVILSDKVSPVVGVSPPLVSTQLLPSAGKILVFLDAQNRLWALDSAGNLTALNGGTITDASWEAFIPPGGPPTPSGDVTHSGRAAVGIAPTSPVNFESVAQFQVNGNVVQDGALFIKQIASALADLADRTQVFRKTSDGGLYSKPVGRTERRIDAPGLTRKTLDAGEFVVVPNGFQYIAYNTLDLSAGPGGNIVLEGDADLVIL
jgi:hypothetical protein